MMSRSTDVSTTASQPAGLSLDRGRLRAVDTAGGLLRAIDLLMGFLRRVDESMRLGDLRAAVVVSTDPLLIAAYTNEFDCAVVLSFPASAGRLLAQDGHQVAEGLRLLTVNNHLANGERNGELDWDLWNGPGARNHAYASYFPIIADLFTADLAAIDARKRDITELEWTRCAEAAREYLERTEGRVRKGSPRLSGLPPLNENARPE